MIMADNKQNTNPNVPNSGNVPRLRFTGYTDEWKNVKIADIAAIVGGGTPDTTISEYWDGDIQWFTPSEIGKSKYIAKSDRTITKEGLNNSSAKILPKGTILLSTRATIGECSIADKECCTNQGFQSIIVKNNTTNEFQYYLIQTKKKDLIRNACGSTFLEISANEVRKIRCNIPNIEEQRKIADFLSLLDKRIETHNKIIEDLKKLKVAICNKLIDNLVNREPLICFSEIYSKAGEGGTPETSKSEYYENGIIPFIKIDDLSNKYITSNKDFITDLGLQKSSAWIIPTHSLIYSNGATIGAISINTYEVCTKQGILGIVPKTSISVEYLYCLMSSNYFSKQVHRIITHGTMATAYLKDINKIKVPIPCMQKQLEIANTVSSVTNKIETELNILSLLKKQKQYLLQQMFI